VTIDNKSCNDILWVKNCNLNKKSGLNVVTPCRANKRRAYRKKGASLALGLNTSAQNEIFDFPRRREMRASRVPKMCHRVIRKYRFKLALLERAFLGKSVRHTEYPSCRVGERVENNDILIAWLYFKSRSERIAKTDQSWKDSR